MNRRLRMLSSFAAAALLIALAGPASAQEGDERGNPEKKVKEYQEAVKKAPEDSESWYNLAFACYRAKKYEDGAAAAAKAAELNPQSINTQLLLGSIASKRNRHAEAIAAFTKAKELETVDPGAKPSIESVMGLALALYESEKWDEAIDAYKQSWKLVKDGSKGDLGAIHNQLGAAYLKKGDTDEAIKWFERNAEIAPNSAATYYNLGMTYRKLAAAGQGSGLWAKSADMFVKYAGMQPDDVIAQFFAGEALLIAGRKAESRPYFDRYLAADPGGKKAIAKFGPAGKSEVYDAALELKAEAAKP